MTEITGLKSRHKRRYHYAVEETNLISIDYTGMLSAAIKEMTVALPYMDTDAQELTRRVMKKLDNLTDSEYSWLSFDLSDDTDG